MIRVRISGHGYLDWEALTQLLPYVLGYNMFCFKKGKTCLQSTWELEQFFLFLLHELEQL